MFFCLLQILHGLTLVYRVKGIDLRVGGCMFSGFEGLEGTRLWGLEINW
jgi:hypothetical protein